MTRASDRLLSRGIARLQHGATIEEFMGTPEAARLRRGQREELRSLLQVAGELIPLRTAAFPTPQAQMPNRARFLGQAAQWREERRSHPLRGWAHAPLQVLRGLLVLTLVVGLVAAVGVAPAAAASLPDSPLYALKTAVEDVRIALALDPSARADLCLRLAELRTVEMLRLNAEARPANEAVVARMEQHLQTALLAAQATRGATQYFWLQHIVTSADKEQAKLREANASATPPSQAMLSHAADVAEKVAGQARQLLQELPVPLPSATPPDTQTPSPTPSTTPSSTVTDTLTPEATGTATPSPIAPVDATQSVGATEPAPPSRTRTPLTRTPVTPSPTATATVESSPTPQSGATTKLPTTSPSRTATRSVSETRTPTPSGTWTPEPTATRTDTPAPTRMPSSTATLSPTVTETPLPTETPIPVYELSLLDNPDPVPAGNRIHYNVLLKNLGEVALTSVRVTVSYSGGCAYYAPNNPGSISWTAGAVTPHNYWAVEFTLETYSTAEGCTVSVSAAMTCDQGTAQAGTNTRVGPKPGATATPTATPATTPAPDKKPGF